MLPVGSRFAPIDLPGWIIDLDAVQCDVFTITFHRQLLQIGRESLEVLLIRQDSDGFGTEEIRVPDGEQTQEDGQVALKRCGAEMLVHFGKTLEKGSEGIWPGGQDR